MELRKIGITAFHLLIAILFAFSKDLIFSMVNTLILYLSGISVGQQNSLVLFQALLTSQITLFSIILSALFVAFQFTSKRYPINFGHNILRSRIAIVTLFLLFISILLNILGMAFLHELSQYQTTIYSASTILISIFVIILSYPFIQITFSRIEPLELLDSMISSINIDEFEKRAKNSKENKMDDHPLRDIYLFIKSEIDRGEMTNATRGIRQLYSISHKIWVEVINSDSEVRDDYQTAEMFTEMLFSGFEFQFDHTGAKYQFDHTGAEHYRRLVLFEPIFTTFPTSLINLATEQKSEDIINEIIFNIEMMGEKSVEYTDNSMLEFSVNCLDRILVSCINNITYSASSQCRLIERIAESANNIYWYSFSQIRIIEDSMIFDANIHEKDSGTEINYYKSPDSKTHFLLSPFYKDMMRTLYNTLPQDRIDENETIVRLHIKHRSGYEKYIKNNEKYYRQYDLELGGIGTPLKRNTDFTSYSEFEEISEFEKEYKQETLVWPLRSFRIDLLWFTEGYFVNTGYPNRIPPCGHLIANWTRVAIFALNNPPQKHHRELLRAFLYLLTKLQYSISTIMRNLYDDETEFASLPNEKRNRWRKLRYQFIGIYLAMEYLFSQGGEEIIQEILDEFKDQKQEYIFEEYTGRYSNSVLWCPLSNETDKERLLEHMESLVALGEVKDSEMETEPKYEEGIIHLLNSSKEDYGKYDW